MDYYKEKYLKYKAKYFFLKKNKALVGGSRRLTGKDWDSMYANKKKYLDTLSNTNSYIARSKMSKRNKIYIIRDNGGSPFKVTCNEEEITIQKMHKTTTDTKPTYEKPFKHIKKFEGYWPGFDASLYSENGNSILVKIKDNKYIHIGYIIYAFETHDDTIIDFIAWMGPNGVPYPLAFGTRNIYFLLEELYLPSNEIKTPHTLSNIETMYNEMYDKRKQSKRKQLKFKQVDKYKLISARLE
jgi:hypothetical protein